MIPTRNPDVLELLNELEERKKVNKTYNVEWEYKKMNGICKDKKTLEHAINLYLGIEREKYRIYSSNFGIELEHLIGMPRNYVKAEIPRLIKEALAQDERIYNVDNFEFEDIDDDALKVTFTIYTQYGEINQEKTVILV